MSTIISLQDWLDKKPDNQKKDERLFLTEEQIKRFPQFQNATPEEVNNIIDTLHDLALISYELFCKDAPKRTENKSISEAA